MTSSPFFITVHGGGYVGLTAAVHYALAGKKVCLYDPDKATVDSINNGTPRAGDFLQYLEADVKKLVSQGLLQATTDFQSVLSCSKHSLAVPTEKDGKPYDVIIESCLLRLIAESPDQTLIIIESTLTPGTINRLRPKIDNALGTHKKLGTNFFVAVCPRRDWFADPQKNLSTLTRIVGGLTEPCTQQALNCLQVVSKSIEVTDYETAEICKALENALLHVPVMFAHELALRLSDKNIAEALRLAGTHWRLMNLHLGFGSGGRCVPLGTKYLVEASDNTLSIGKQAIAIDESIRKTIAETLSQQFPKAKILVLGIGYRPDFKDAGLSPGLAIAQNLQNLGCAVSVHDPLWTQDELEKLTGLTVQNPGAHHQVILLATPHKVFLDLPYEAALWTEGQVILDANGAWSQHRDFFERKKIIYKKVGEPNWLQFKKTK